MEHSWNCNCEDCCWARGGEICSTCGCLDCEHSSSASSEDAPDEKKLLVGDKVRVTHNEETWDDVVRKLFRQTILLEPHGRNIEIDAVVLTIRSWVPINECEKI